MGVVNDVPFCIFHSSPIYGDTFSAISMDCAVHVTTCCCGQRYHSVGHLA